MKRKIIGLSSALLVATLITMTGALLTNRYDIEQMWIVNSNVALSVSLNGSVYVAVAPFDWGFVSPATTYTVDLTVVNMGTLPCRVWVESVGLPAGFTQAWSSDNSVIPIGGSASGDFTLYVPLNATNGMAFFTVHAEEAT